MIDKGYYEGTNNIEDINDLNNRQIKIEYINDLEDETLKLILDWETKQSLK